MKYKDFRFLFPPRPAVATSPNELTAFEKEGYEAQVKKNGTCNIMAFSPDRDLFAMNRHAETHKLWTPDKKIISTIADKLKGGWFVFVAELLHSKIAGGPRHTNYIHDVLVADGEYLVGVSQRERYDLLHSIFLNGDEEETYSHYVVDEKTWIARQHTSGFRQFFDEIVTQGNPEDEGLVLKHPEQVLNICSKEKANVTGMVKIRVPHKNYSF
jgi:hypothetical protein